MRIVVAGRYADVSRQGGATWAILQYALGFRRLGHDVWLAEPIDGVSREVLRRRKEIAAAFGFHGRTGVPVKADVLVNISGLLRDEEALERIPARVYLDLDPAFTQLWHMQGIDMGFDLHTHFLTVGQGIGLPGSPVPDCGRVWNHTLPPVVLAEWPVGNGIVHDGLTTVGNWRSYGSVVADGVVFGQRAHSVRALLSLPSLTDEAVRPAFAIHPDETNDLAALRAHGWVLLDPSAYTASADAYRDFVCGSKAELGIAKSGYVVSHCGWFSDRSACYLAAGRPVVAQETGFSRVLPTGEGLLAFSTAEEAAAAIGDVARNYERHRIAARAIAEEHLDSDVVLTRLVESL